MEQQWLLALSWILGCPNPTKMQHGISYCCPQYNQEFEVAVIVSFWCRCAWHQHLTSNSTFPEQSKRWYERHLCVSCTSEQGETLWSQRCSDNQEGESIWYLAEILQLAQSISSLDLSFLPTAIKGNNGRLFSPNISNRSSHWQLMTWSKPTFPLPFVFPLIPLVFFRVPITRITWEMNSNLNLSCRMSYLTWSQLGCSQQFWSLLTPIQVCWFCKFIFLQWFMETINL